ncbi:hypothetical protein LTR97_012200 [Elasticomyces elasticus]|uniref:Uncharacterized protein n=1 Tax=Elasticomyces elasticus TaxID=574655 RepID=A0AAN7W0R3_9PEZI|nr:hypothetical protein LTR97_012200 [Elasticomyces elasticus]
MARVTDEITVQSEWQAFEFFRVEPGTNPVIEAQVYWINRQLEDSSPIFADDQHTKLLPGIFPWCSPIEQEIENIQAYEAFWPEGAARTPANKGHLVWGRVRLTKQHMNVKVAWDIAPPRYRPYNNKNKVFQAPPESSLVHLGTRSLHRATHTAFIQRVGAASVPRAATEESPSDSDDSPPPPKRRQTRSATASRRLRGQGGI